MATPTSPRRSDKRSTIGQFKDRALEADSSSTIASYLSLLPPPPRFARFRQYVIFHRGDLARSLQVKFASQHPGLRLVNDHASAFSLEIQSDQENKERVTGIFVVLPGTEANFYRIITICYTPFWNRAVRRLVRSLYPDAMPVFFKQSEMKEALHSLQTLLGHSYRISISEVTMKRQLRDGSSTTKAKFETDRLWTDLSVEDAFDQALEGNYWFRSVQFTVEKLRRRTKRFGKVSVGRIYKQGEIHYDFLHSEINDAVVAVLERRAAERLLLLSGRGIRERNYKPGRPIEIVYHRDVFSDLEEIKRFGAIAARYPHATKAVYHANPYYHASVADFLDGSSFDIWILSPERILISPQARCSERALERFISHIFFEFQEGTLDEYSG